LLGKASYIVTTPTTNKKRRKRHMCDGKKKKMWEREKCVSELLRRW